MRKRKTPVRTNLVAQSKLAKIATAGARRNAREVFAAASGKNFLKGRTSEDYVSKRVMQASVGRTLDMIKVFNRKKRAEVQASSQTFADESATNRARAMAAGRIEKALGEKKAEWFFYSLKRVHRENIEQTSALYRAYAPAELSKKIRDN